MVPYPNDGKGRGEVGHGCRGKDNARPARNAFRLTSSAVHEAFVGLALVGFPLLYQGWAVGGGDDADLSSRFIALRALVRGQVLKSDFEALDDA
jgi:hypothetical protein